MHFHLPKPLHGWREFAGEVGIIVVGVLIALGAEQVVEGVHNHRQAQKAIAAIHFELAHSAGVFDERAVVQKCLDQRLKQIDTIVRTARRTGRLPDISEIGRPPVRPIELTAWSSAVSTDVVSHFDDQQRDALSLIYSQASSNYDDVVAEQEMWATLKLLEHAPGPIDGALLAEVAATHAKLQFRSFLDGITAVQLLEAIRAEGVQPDYFLVNQIADEHNRGAMIDLSRKRPVCAPLLVDGRPAA